MRKSSIADKASSFYHLNRGRERQCDVERRSLPKHAFYPDPSTMARDDFFDEVEANAKATQRAVLIAGPVEAFEDQWYLFRSDADSLILDPDQGLILIAQKTQTNFDTASGRAVFYGVANQVVENLGDALFIDEANQLFRGWQLLQGEIQGVQPRGDLLALDSLQQQREHVARRALEHKLRLFDTSDIEHLFDQMGQLQALLGNIDQSGLHQRVQRLLIGIPCLQLQDFGKALDDGNRRAQFVVGHGEEFIFMLLQRLLSSHVLEDDHCAGHDALIGTERCA